MDKKKKVITSLFISLGVVALIGGTVWYLSKNNQSSTVQQNVSELKVGNKQTGDDTKGTFSSDKRVVVETSNAEYTFDENSKNGTAPLSNEEYQKMIDDNSTIQERDTGQEVEESVKTEVIDKINQALSAFPKADPKFSSSPETYAYYDVAKEQFGDKDALKELQNIIQYNEVSVGTVNVAKTITRNEIAYEFIVLKSDTQEQVGYVTGIYDTDSKKLTSTYSTILRDGQISTNNWLSEHSQW